jgi:hypothetical protein
VINVREARDTCPDVSVIVIGLGGDDKIFSGLASNFARHPAEQKKYSVSLYDRLWRAVAGFTSIPQTGSFFSTLAEVGTSFGGFTGSRLSIGELNLVQLSLPARSHLAESGPY